MRYGPPTLTLGSVYAPPLRAVARYCVPLGTCTATTVAPLIGVAAVSLTKPVRVAVVTPCAGAPCGAAMIDSTSKTSDRPNVETRGISASRDRGWTGRWKQRRFRSEANATSAWKHVKAGLNKPSCAPHVGSLDSTAGRRLP